MKRRLGKQERCGAAPATMTRNSGEVGHDYGVGKLAKVLTYSTIGSARRWGRSRRTRRSYGEGVVRVDAAVSKLCDGGAMAEWLLAAALAVASGEMKKDWRGRRQARGGFKARLRRQEAHGAWPARSAGLRRAAHTRPAFSEKRDHCSFHSVGVSSLTARLPRGKLANPLLVCKNSVHEKCRPNIHLQFTFKNHHLIRHGSEVTTSQRWLDHTEMISMT